MKLYLVLAAASAFIVTQAAFAAEPTQPQTPATPPQTAPADKGGTDKSSSAKPETKVDGTEQAAAPKDPKAQEPTK